MGTTFYRTGSRTTALRVIEEDRGFNQQINWVWNNDWLRLLRCLTCETFCTRSSWRKYLRYPKTFHFLFEKTERERLAATPLTTVYNSFLLFRHWAKKTSWGLSIETSTCNAVQRLMPRVALWDLEELSGKISLVFQRCNLFLVSP